MKTGQILIDVESYMSGVSLLEEGRLKEYYVEYKESGRITGNIYKGQVVNVLQGMQTAFVNIGLARNAFLYVGETLEDRTVLRKSGAIPTRLDIKEGDYVMVQVTKEETELKGARLSMNLSLPGRYVVYLPTIDFIGVSNKITDEETRAKLFRLLEKIKPEGGGFIARTVCKDSKKSDILAEAKQLQQAYADICARFDAAEGISLIHNEGDLIFRTVRDMLGSNVDSIICNDPTTVEALKKNFREMKSKFVDRVMLYESEYDMSDAFGILNEVDKLLERKAELPSGGFIIIDHTEALTAVDVNTGRYIGVTNHEDTVFKTNLEAAVEIARQLRLRNIGGIIVVDFIDMMVEEHKTAVVETLKAELLNDRTKTRVLDMSGLGLVEITRKKTGNELSTVLLDTCPYCKGSAFTHSGDYVARKIKAQLKKLFAENAYDNAVITINANIFEHMFASRFFSADCETIWRDKRIYMVPSETVKPKNFTITGNNSTYINLPQGARLLY